jgi:hypothetical protein
MMLINFLCLIGEHRLLAFKNSNVIIGQRLPLGIFHRSAVFITFLGTIGKSKVCNKIDIAT